MSYLNLMGNKLKPKEVNDALESLTNGTPTPTPAPIEISADDVEYDNTTSHLSATNVQSAIDEINTTVNAIPVIDRVTYTGDTNASGAIAIPATSAPLDKTITINVVSPTGKYCDFSRGSTTHGVLVKDRTTDAPVTETECVFEIWKIK